MIVFLSIIVAVCHSRLLFFNFTLFFSSCSPFFDYSLYRLGSSSFILSFSNIFYRLHTWHEYSFAWTRNPWCLCDYNNFVVLHYRPLSALNCMDDISSTNVQFFFFQLIFPLFLLQLQSLDSIVIITSLRDTSTLHSLVLFTNLFFILVFVDILIALHLFAQLFRSSFKILFHSISPSLFNLLDHFRKSQATCMWLWVWFLVYGNFNIMCIFATVEFPLTELISKSTFKSLCAHELRPYRQAGKTKPEN